MCSPPRQPSGAGLPRAGNERTQTEPRAVAAAARRGGKRLSTQVAQEGRRDPSSTSLASGDPSACNASSPISRYLHRYPRGNAPQIAIRRVQNGGMLTVVGKNYVAPAPLTFHELCLEIEWTAAFLVHFIGAWPGGGTLADAQDDQSLLHGVQRQMEIICAAVERLAKIDAGIAQRI